MQKNNKDKRYPNYTKTYRKKSGLSQSEVSYMLGAKSSHSVHCSEKGIVSGGISKALTYQIIFGSCLEKIFPDLSKEIALHTLRRIAVLSKQLELHNQTPEIRRKVSFLDTTAGLIASKYSDI